MHLSLHSKMREMHRVGILELRKNPAIHHFPGEGRMYYKGHKVEYINEHTGPAPDGSMDFDEPHDIAWVPALKYMVAYAESYHEPFIPLKEPLKIRGANKRTNSVGVDANS